MMTLQKMHSKEDMIEKWKDYELVKDELLINAFRKIPREEFLPGDMRKYAYDDTALPTISDSTISQPTTIMIMLQALELKKEDIVLELGAGTGYSAALMAQLCKQVHTIEIDPELCEYAKTHLARQNIKNVEVHCRDGTLGLPEKAPFDKIVSTAGLPKIPKSWIAQLKEGGIIVAPVGSRYSQVMIKARKIKGKLVEEVLGNFIFLPARGEEGFD